MTAQSANYKWNDLEKSSSPWRLTLLDALGHELPPVKIQVEKLPDAYEMEFFPAKTPFSKTYSVRFVSRQPASSPASRQVRSPFGSVVPSVASS